MTIEEEFNEWFREQLDDGLVDFKLDVRSAPEGSTKEDAMAEISFCEKQIALGNVEEFPPEPDQPSAGAEYIICTCLAGMELDRERLAEIMKQDAEGKCKEYSDY